MTLKPIDTLLYFFLPPAERRGGLLLVFLLSVIASGQLHVSENTVFTVAGGTDLHTASSGSVEKAQSASSKIYITEGTVVHNLSHTSVQELVYIKLNGSEKHKNSRRSITKNKASNSSKEKDVIERKPEAAGTYKSLRYPLSPQSLFSQNLMSPGCITVRYHKELFTETVSAKEPPDFLFQSNHGIPVYIPEAGHSDFESSAHPERPPPLLG